MICAYGKQNIILKIENYFVNIKKSPFTLTQGQTIHAVAAAD